MGGCLSKLLPRRRNDEENQQDAVLSPPMELLQVVVSEEPIENEEATRPQPANELLQVVDSEEPIENEEATRPRLANENLQEDPRQLFFQERSVIISIDLGTTYTGCAYSFRHEFVHNPERIFACRWVHEDGIADKAPTAILLTPDKKVQSFGYKAQKEYAELSQNGNHSEYFFFYRFKMMLYTEKRLSFKTTIKDAMGKKLPALVVFSKILEFLKQYTLAELQKRDTNLYIPIECVHWVVTIPAIWNDKAKQFMRRAMSEAGIQDSNSTLALEPEAAALFCRYRPNRCSRSEVPSYFFDENKYIVMDLGGGTVDIAMHSVNQDGKFQEIHHPTGGYWGGTTVDAEFQLLLERILGQDICEKAKLKHPEEFLELERNFELKKREFKSEQDSDVRVRIPSEIIRFYEKECSCSFKDAIYNSEYKNEIKLQTDKLSIASKVFQSLFSKSLKSIIDHAETLLSGPGKDIGCILLVGGYADSDVILSEMRHSFPQKRIIKPTDSRLAVLKGAVIFGHEPHVISVRVCSRTYGIAIQTRFDVERHDSVHRLQTRDGYVCDNVFDIHMNIGDRVKIDETRPAKSYFAPPGSPYILLDVFTSTDKSPKYVTEQGCAKLGSITIDFDGVNSDVGNMVDVTLDYCGTELGVKACLQGTENLISARFDFLG